MARALACAVAGVIFAFAGYRLIKRFEAGPERHGFHTVDWPHTLGYWGGYCLLFMGLYLLMIMTPLLWLGRAR